MGLSKEVCSHAGADWLKFICQRAARDRNVTGSFLFPWRKKSFDGFHWATGKFSDVIFPFWLRVAIVCFWLRVAIVCAPSLYFGTVWVGLHPCMDLGGHGKTLNVGEVWDVCNSKSEMADEWWWWRSRLHKRQLMSTLSALLLGTGGGLGGNKRSLLLGTCLLFYGGEWGGYALGSSG